MGQCHSIPNNNNIYSGDSNRNTINADTDNNSDKPISPLLQPINQLINHTLPSFELESEGAAVHSNPIQCEVQCKPLHHFPPVQPLDLDLESSSSPCPTEHDEDEDCLEEKYMEYNGAVDKPRVVFVSLVALLPVWADIPAEILHDSIIVINAKRSWLFPTTLYDVREARRMWALSKLEFPPLFMHLLSCKDAQNTILYLQDSQNDVNMELSVSRQSSITMPSSSGSFSVESVSNRIAEWDQITTQNRNLNRSYSNLATFFGGAPLVTPFPTRGYSGGNTPIFNPVPAPVTPIPEHDLACTAYPFPETKLDEDLEDNPPIAINTTLNANTPKSISISNGGNGFGNNLGDNSNLITAQWRFVAKEMSKISDTKTGRNYAPLNLAIQYWLNIDISQLQFCDSPMQVLRELYCGEGRFDAIMEILFQSNPTLIPIRNWNANLYQISISKINDSLRNQLNNDTVTADIQYNRSNNPINERCDTTSLQKFIDLCCTIPRANVASMATAATVTVTDNDDDDDDIFWKPSDFGDVCDENGFVWLDYNPNF